MPKHGRKGKATAKPLAIPSLDNKLRYSTPEVQLQLPKPEPTLAIKAKYRGLPTVNVDGPMQRAGGGLTASQLEERKEWQEKQKRQVQREQATQEKMSTHEGSDVEECEFVGPWVVKGNPIGFLDSENEEVLEAAALTDAREVMDSLGKDKWRSAAIFLMEGSETIRRGLEPEPSRS